MTYKEKLKSIKTVEELFDFRDELKADNKKYSDLWEADGYKSDSEHLVFFQESCYFINRVEAQIEHFEKIGKLLTSIPQE